MIPLRKLALAALLALFSLQASAAAIALFDYRVNVDGNTAPGGVNLAAFDTGSGLGRLTVSVSGAGSHYVGLFVDHEIDEATNTFFNEFGTATGAPAAGQTWEIDEPGFVFGNIFANFLAGTLDNGNGVPASTPDDVSMALAWALSLAAGEFAVVDFLLSETAPSSGFYLAQTDPDSAATIYFSSRAEIGRAVPEPGSLALFVLAFLGLATRAAVLAGTRTAPVRHASR